MTESYQGLVAFRSDSAKTTKSHSGILKCATHFLSGFSQGRRQNSNPRYLGKFGEAPRGGRLLCRLVCARYRFQWAASQCSPFTSHISLRLHSLAAPLESPPEINRQGHTFVNPSASQAYIGNSHDRPKSRECLTKPIELHCLPGVMLWLGQRVQSLQMRLCILWTCRILSSMESRSRPANDVVESRQGYKSK